MTRAAAPGRPWSCAPTRTGPRRTTYVLALALAAVALTGCGDDGSDYCTTLKSEQKTLTTLADRADQRNGDVLTPTLTAFNRLRAVAPQQLSDEWDTVVFAYRALADAVKEAGVDPADYRPGKRLAGVTPAQARHLAAVAAELD